jgi:GAF domain-containing protein/HAMP domain-containing protein
LILAIASFAALGIANRLTTPLKSLTSVANEIIHGNFDAKAQVQNQDELGTLAETLNVMTSNFKNLVRSLEERVSERTAELQDELVRGELRGKQFEAIAKVSQTISAARNLQELLPQISKVVSEYFGFYHVGIFLNDASHQYAVLAAANSIGGQRMLKRGHQLKIGEQGIVGHVTGTGTPRIALDVGEDVVFFNNPDLPETHSEMALPLKISGRIIGALDVQSTKPNAFSTEDVEVLSTLADQISLAIENARLFDQTKKTLVEAEAIQRKYVRETWGRLPKEEKLSGYRYSIAGAIPLDEEAAPSENEEKKDQQEINVPIILRGETIGTLSVQVPKGEHIGTDQVDLIKAVAERVALSAENARLFEATTRRAERERIVSDITTRIRGTNDPQEMIRTAGEELQRALGATRVEIVPQKVTHPTDK